jgi:uncharacterized protein (TIGR02266 family)
MHWGWIGVAAVALGAMVALAARRSNRRRVALGGATIAMAGLFGTFSASAPAEAAGDDQNADAIGRVISSASRWDSGLIVTKLAIEPSCVTRRCERGRIEVEVYGGSAGGLSQIVGHDAVPRVGARIPLRWNDGRVEWPLRFPVRRDPRRAHERAPASATVRVGEERRVGVLENISQGGAFVATETAGDVGSHVAVELSLPGRTAPLLVTGEVRWNRAATATEAPGFGLRFVNLSSDQAGAIRAYVDEHASVVSL